MGFDLRQTCKKCGTPVDLNNIRAAPDGGYLCRSCLETTAAASPRGMPSRNTTAGVDQTENVLGSSETFFEQKSYACDHCDYQFKRGSDFVVRKCPFCGKVDGVHQIVEKPADKLLDGTV